MGDLATMVGNVGVRLFAAVDEIREISSGRCDVTFDTTICLEASISELACASVGRR